MSEIKMVITDLDGTLLDDHKNMSARMKQVLTALQEKNIRFVAASGRQYYNIRKQFAWTGFVDKIDYIAENGGMVGMEDKIIFCDKISKDMLRSLIMTIRETDGCWPIICGKDYAYFEDDFEEMIFNVNLYYERNRLVKDLLEVLDEDDFCGFSVYASGDADQTAYPALLPYGDRMQVALSGDSWVDVMNLSVNKGNALAKLMEKRGVRSEECMAFGDFLNDLPMLELCGRSFAMENGHPLLREKIPCSGGNNNEEGVVNTICRELGICENA